MTDWTARSLVDNERSRQEHALGYTPEHDDGHTDGEIARMGACYADAGATQLYDGTDLATEYGSEPHPFWPGTDEGDGSWHPSDNPLRNLVKAAALIEAEIDKHLRRGAQPLDALHHETHPDGQGGEVTVIHGGVGQAPTSISGEAPLGSVHP